MKKNSVRKFIAFCCFTVIAGLAIQTYAQEKQPLRLVQTIPLPGVKGRLDHMDADVEGKRLFVAAVENGTLEVANLGTGKVVTSLPGFAGTQAVWFLGGDLNKLYVTSLDGMLTIFHADTLRVFDTIKLGPGPNRLLYDPATKLMYVTFGGMDAGFDYYGRVGIVDVRTTKFIADMIAPTLRPGHLAEMVFEDGGQKVLACDSRANMIFQFDTIKRQLIKSWPARGDGGGDMSIDPVNHRLFVGTRTPPEMTVYDSESGKEIASLPTPEEMDGVYYDAQLKRIYVTGGRWFGQALAPEGWVYVYQQKDPDHYELMSKVKTRPGSGTSLFEPKLNRFYIASQATDAQEAAILVYEPQP
jgi:hypothetical protein